VLQRKQYDSGLDEDPWFRMEVEAYPNMTDYAGIVWHGNYIRWFEDARINYFQACGIFFKDLQKASMNFVVTEVNVKYRGMINAFERAVVKCRLVPLSGVRVIFDYSVVSLSDDEEYCSGTVSMVALDTNTNKIMRRLPDHIKAALEQGPPSSD